MSAITPPSTKVDPKQNLQTKQENSFLGETSRTRLKKQEQRLFQGVQKAHRSGKRKLAAYKLQQYLTAYAPRRIAVEKAYKKMKPGLRPQKDLLPKIAQELNAYQGTEEIVKVTWQPKKSNPYDYRAIMNFGIENRALQYLVDKCLKVQAELHPMQFATNGGGHAAVQKAFKLMQSGYVYVVEMDITNCFPSFDGDKLAKLLPLPKEVTEHVVLSTHFKLVPARYQLGQSWDSSEEALIFFSDGLTEARQGIAQGSVTSSIVSEILLSSVLPQLPDCGVALSYADNILLLAKSSKEVVTMIKALSCVLQSHPAGPLKLKEPKKYMPGQSVEFLGYSLSIGNKKGIIEPTLENLHKFEAEFKGGIKKITGKHSTKLMQEKAANSLMKYVESWTQAFPLWPELKQYRDSHIAMIKTATPG